ncbi:hypothetical protein GGR55DRAFT_635286 [Xylaria sp. FL0064]|nr:hypothetical protein GGR55DRAFT_635286 [Xylaria sp. FL0064]
MFLYGYLPYFILFSSQFLALLQPISSNMSQLIFQLLGFGHPSDSHAFIEALKTLPVGDKPLWVGKVRHWFAEPSYTKDQLMKKWDYLVIGHQRLPDHLQSSANANLTITSNSAGEMPAISAIREQLLAKPIPPLPSGWSVDDHSGLDAAVPHDGVKYSLDTTSQILGSELASDRITWKDFIVRLSKTYSGPISVLNILPYQPGQRQAFLEGYVGGFNTIMSPNYGGGALCFGTDVALSSQEGEDEDFKWDDISLVWYPSVWHFGKMFDDPEYAQLDREFKPALRDNPLLCCTEIEI